MIIVGPLTASAETNDDWPANGRPRPASYTNVIFLSQLGPEWPYEQRHVGDSLLGSSTQRP